MTDRQLRYMRDLKSDDEKVRRRAIEGLARAGIDRPLFEEFRSGGEVAPGILGSAAANGRRYHERLSQLAEIWLDPETNNNRRLVSHCAIEVALRTRRSYREEQTRQLLVPIGLSELANPNRTIQRQARELLQALILWGSKQSLDDILPPLQQMLLNRRHSDDILEHALFLMGYSKNMLKQFIKQNPGLSEQDLLESPIGVVVDVSRGVCLRERAWELVVAWTDVLGARRVVSFLNERLCSHGHERDDIHLRARNFVETWERGISSRTSQAEALGCEGNGPDQASEENMPKCTGYKFDWTTAAGAVRSGKCALESVERALQRAHSDAEKRACLAMCNVDPERGLDWIKTRLGFVAKSYQDKDATTIPMWVEALATYCNLDKRDDLRRFLDELSNSIPEHWETIYRAKVLLQLREATDSDNTGSAPNDQQRTGPVHDREKLLGDLADQDEENRLQAIGELIKLSSLEGEFRDWMQSTNLGSRLSDSIDHSNLEIRVAAARVMAIGGDRSEKVLGGLRDGLSALAKPTWHCWEEFHQQYESFHSPSWLSENVFMGLVELGPRAAPAAGDVVKFVRAILENTSEGRPHSGLTDLQLSFCRDAGEALGSIGDPGVELWIDHPDLWDVVSIPHFAFASPRNQRVISSIVDGLDLDDPEAAFRLHELACFDPDCFDDRVRTQILVMLCRHLLRGDACSSVSFAIAGLVWGMGYADLAAYLFLIVCEPGLFTDWWLAKMGIRHRQLTDRAAHGAYFDTNTEYRIVNAILLRTLEPDWPLRFPDFSYLKASRWIQHILKAEEIVRTIDSSAGETFRNGLLSLFPHSELNIAWTPDARYVNRHSMDWKGPTDFSMERLNEWFERRDQQCRDGMSNLHILTEVKDLGLIPDAIWARLYHLPLRGRRQEVDPPWQEKDALELMWKDVKLGAVTLTGADQPWVFAEFTPRDLPPKIQAFLSAWSEHGFDLFDEGPPAELDADLLEMEDWHLYHTERQTDYPISPPQVDWEKSTIEFNWQ